MASSPEDCSETQSIELFDPFDGTVVVCIVDGVPYSVRPETIRIGLQNQPSLLGTDPGTVGIEFVAPECVHKSPQPLETDVILINQSLTITFVDSYLSRTKVTEMSTTFSITAVDYEIKRR